MKLTAEQEFEKEQRLKQWVLAPQRYEDELLSEYRERRKMAQNLARNTRTKIIHDVPGGHGVNLGKESRGSPVVVRLNRKAARSVWYVKGFAAELKMRLEGALK